MVLFFVHPRFVVVHVHCLLVPAAAAVCIVPARDTQACHTLHYLYVPRAATSHSEMWRRQQAGTE